MSIPQSENLSNNEPQWEKQDFQTQIENVILSPSWPLRLSEMAAGIALISSKNLFTQLAGLGLYLKGMTGGAIPAMFIKGEK